MAGAYAIVSRGGKLPFGSPEAMDISRLSALAPWRLGQGIYRFDPDLYAALLNTDLDRAVPWDPLYRLPEWCLYIETPSMAWSGRRIYGCYTHLEFDPNDGRSELRLLLDLDQGLLPIPLHLVPGGTLRDSVDAFLFEAARVTATQGVAAAIPEASELGPDEIKPIQALVSLVLYLCSQEPDMDGQPAKIQPVKTKKGPRSIPRDQPRVWEVGARIGAALRRAQAQHEAPTGSPAGEGHHASPIPHLRKAHWHGFYVGPRSEPSARRMEIRWLPPILVGNRDGDALQAVIHPVS
jgi:hypothetical protein